MDGILADFQVCIKVLSADSNFAGPPPHSK